MGGMLAAFDTVVFAEAFLGRLKNAQKLLARRQLPDEKQWLQTAVDRLAAVVEPVTGLTARAAQLPELEPVRGELAKSLQHAALDAVERLQAGIVFHAGPRAPLLEELFKAYKLAPLRKAPREDFEKFTASFTKKLKAQYVKRILAGDDYAPVAPAVAQVAASFEAWRTAFSPEPLPEGEADKLRAQLTVAADSLAQPLHQAQLLAEAALLSIDGAFAEAGLAAKPKKRAAAKVAAPVAEETMAAAPAPEVIEQTGKKGRAVARG